MGDILKITINLTLICAVAGILISGVWAETEPVKLRKEAAEREAALKELMPGMDAIKPVKTFELDGKTKNIYRAVKDGKTEGYIVESMGRGYSSYIKMLVAVDEDNTVTGLDILDQKETPGLGNQVEEDWFKKRFVGKTLDTLVIVKHETDTEVQAISGATISSRGVNKGVRAAVEEIVKERKEGLDDIPMPEEKPQTTGTAGTEKAAGE